MSPNRSVFNVNPFSVGKVLPSAVETPWYIPAHLWAFRRFGAAIGVKALSVQRMHAALFLDAACILLGWKGNVSVSLSLIYLAFYTNIFTNFFRISQIYM